MTARRPVTSRIALGSLLALALVLAGVQATPSAAQVAEPPVVTARGAVVWDPDDDLVLHGVDESVGRPMASTTKIMTLLLALEAGAAADTVTVSAGAAALGGATLDLYAGQQLAMESFVAGLLLRSGNDAAVAVAEHVSGSEAAFVERMNARAAELGLADTGFVNASGLTDDLGHRASPLDLARLARVAMDHDVFATYAGAAEATVPGLAPMVSRNELLGRYEGADGVKTGFTTLAGWCLVASATRDGRRLYAVVLGSEESFADAAALLDYGFEAFERSEPVAAGEVVGRYRWAGADVGLVAAEPLAATVPAGTHVWWRTSLDPLAARPLAAGAPLGVAELVVGGEVRRSTPLTAAAAVPAPAVVTAPAGQVGAALQDALRAFGRLPPVERDF